MIKNRILRLFDNKITLFIFAFFLMVIYLFPAKDLFAGSGDAVETWKVVTTFFSPTPYHSYVMYKGFLAFIPNVAFYQLSLLFNLDQFFFVKLFNCIGFAYITTIGLPYFFSFIFRKKIEYYKIYILTFVLYFGIRINFSFISVDFPSILVMMLMVNSAIRIKISEKKLPLYYYIYSGIIFAMSASFSGQYLPAFICTLLFLIFSKVMPMIKRKEIRVRFFVVLACFVVGFSSINISNNYFVATRVQPARDAGEWLPTGGQWLKFGLTNNMLYSKFMMLPDNRGKAILIKENANIQAIEQGGGEYSYQNYVKLVLKYPVDFVMRWLNRLFLGISVDNGKFSSTYLSFKYIFASYTLLFLSLLTIKQECEKLKNVFNSRAFLILALITPSLVPCILHVEMRYFMSIQILIAGTALLSDTFWKSLSGFKEFVKSITINRKDVTIPCGEIRINYSFISYMIFIALCFMLLATQYELIGPKPNILFNF